MVFVVLATIACGFFLPTPVMIVMLALLDDVPIMTIAFDNAAVPLRPVRWQMDRVLLISSVLGDLAVGFGILVPALSRGLIGLAWVYNLAWMLVLEMAKLAVYRELEARATGRPRSGGPDAIPDGRRPRCATRACSACGRAARCG